MTYCCGVLVSDGLVMIADTRTNAGVDNISTFRKLNVVSKPGEHVLALATAGSLSVTQSAMSLMQEGLFNPETGQIETLDGQTSMFRAAQFVGHALHKATDGVKSMLAGAPVEYGATVLLGGQVAGGPMRLFMIYGVGNFIECGPDVPFLQIGEPKYGKPILDRALAFDTPLEEVLKVGLISFELTIRSNLAVGAPLDVLVLERDSLDPRLDHRIEGDDAYWRGLSDQWSAAMRAAAEAIPPPPYGRDDLRRDGA